MLNLDVPLFPFACAFVKYEVPKVPRFTQALQVHVVFLIGGPFGIDKSILERSSYVLSLSNMTFSHQMIRLFFCEQLYRGFSILRNEKYHHE